MSPKEHHPPMPEELAGEIIPADRLRNLPMSTKNLMPWWRRLIHPRWLGEWRGQRQARKDGGK